MSKDADQQLPKPLVYASSSILERRRTIIREARRMIAENGLSQFSVRELCARAGVAQRTLYNAFGGIDNIIALAVNDYYRSFERTMRLRHAEDTLDGRLERLVRVHSRNVEIKPYTRAVMSVYWSAGMAQPVREITRKMAIDSNTPYLEALVRRRGLVRPDIARINDLLIINSYGTLGEWCAGGFADSELVPRMAGGLLAVMAGVTRGAARREVDDWLMEVLEEGERWRALAGRRNG